MLYLSPRPLTKIFPEPSCFEIPVVLVTAVPTSPTPFLANSWAPMEVLIVVALFWSNKSAVSESFLALTVITTSSNATPSEAPIGTLRVVTFPSETKTFSTVTVSYPK